MRDPQVIASEIDRARHDLDENLGALKALVRNKLDVKQRARDAIDRGLHQLDRGLHQLGEAMQRIRDRARQYPAIALLTACAVGVLACVYVRRRRD